MPAPAQDPADRVLTLALVQHPAPASGETAELTDRLRSLVTTYPQIDLWVFPELHLDTPHPAVDPLVRARPLDDRRGRTLAALAAELGIWLIPGSVYEQAPDGRVFNTLPVYSPTGAAVAAYRKIFCWRPWETVDRGAGFAVVQIPGKGCVGLSICFDAWFPELFRHLAWLGADLVVNVVQTPTADREAETVLVRSHAIVNQVWVASVNAAAPTGVGRSLLVDPHGQILVAAAGAEEQVLTAAVDLAAVARTRRFGTAALTRPWAQFDPVEDRIPLPLYNGFLDPRTWRPGGRPEQDPPERD